MDNFAENVSKHFGLPWTGLIEHCRKTKKDKPPDELVQVGESSKVSTSTITRLLKEDASTFGLRPALDECLLALCNQCGAVIKPQALYSHIERRHKDINDGTSVQHLLTEKPIVKGPALKSKIKNSPRNSPKLASNCDTNLLDKYKLPNRPVNRISTGKFAPGSIERTNSALAKHLSSASAQPVVALDDVNPKLNSSLVNLSGSGRHTESPRDSLVVTPKTSLVSTAISSSYPSKKYNSKRSLDSSLCEISKSEPPKKLKAKHGEAVQTHSNSKDSESNPDVQEDASLEALTSSLSPLESFKNMPSPQDVYGQLETDTTSYSQSDLDNTFICAEKLKPPPSIKVHQLTTFDKSIPCKDREYDPNRHCGCWLDDWGKHCTRSLTCKSHALSLRRKVAGRSKPFDTLLQDHREAKEALQLNKTKTSKGKTSSGSSNITKVKRPSVDHKSQPSVFGESEFDRLEATRTQVDYLGYSSFHPRPLAAPSYDARLCGNAYVQNRQMDILRMAVKYAIEQPKLPNNRKSATKGVKSINGSAAKVNRTSKDGSSTVSLNSSSLALLQKAQSAVKCKNLVEKKKGSKRPSTDNDPPPKVSPPFSHRMTSPIGITHPSTIHSSAVSSSLSSSSLPIKSVVGGVNSSTLNLITNGATPIYRANMLKDLGIHTSRQKGSPLEVNKMKLNNRNSIHLTTNASGIATLANKHLTILDSHTLPYVYSASGANNSNEQSIPSGIPPGQLATLNSSDIISRAASANGIVMQGSERNTRLDNQSTLVELVPKSASTHITVQQHHPSGIQCADLL